jgi:hypothetical protein
MSQISEPQAAGEPRLKGIGGWLVLMSIGQVLGPLQILRGMIEEYSSLPEGTVAAFPMAMLGDVLIRLAFIGFLVYAAILFFNKRTEFPGMFVKTYVASLLMPFVIGAWVTITSGVNTMANLATADFLWPYLAAVAIGGIWVAYVLNSERVRNTFVQ